MSNTHTTRERFVGQVCTADRGGALQKKTVCRLLPPLLPAKPHFTLLSTGQSNPECRSQLKCITLETAGPRALGKWTVRSAHSQFASAHTHTHTAGKRTLKPLCSCGQLVSEVCKMRCDNWPLDWAPTDRSIDPVRECCANNSCKRLRWVCQAVTQGAQLLVHGNHAA